MPWKIVKGHGSCSSSKPYAVVKTSDGEVEGCHESREKAKRQLAALNISEQKKASSAQELREAMEWLRDRK